MTEADFVPIVLEQLRPHFHVAQEVWMKHYTGKAIRIDAAIKPRAGCRFPPGVYGLEIKGPRASSNGGYSRAVAQCVDYVNATFDDDRFRLHNGERPQFVFLATLRRWLWAPKEKEYWQSDRIIGRLNVGIVTMVNLRNELRIELCGERFWSVTDGARSDAATFNRKRKVGSR